MKVASDDVGQMKVALREVSGNDCVPMKLLGSCRSVSCRAMHHCAIRLSQYKLLGLSERSFL